MKKVFNQANLYILLWCMYFMQGELYAKGSLIARIILVIVLIISVYNALVANLKYKLPSYFKGLNILLLMFLFYGTLLILGGNYLPNGTSKIGYLQQILISLLPIYSAYVYTRQGLISKDSFKLWIPIWIILVTISYYSNQVVIVSNLSGDNREITNNVAYTFVSLIPSLIVFSRKPFIQYTLLLYCFFFILSGMKRGAILIAVLLGIYLILNSYRIAPKNKRKYIILFALLIVVALYSVVSTMLIQSEYFNVRIEQTLAGQTSGRDVLYGIFVQYFFSETSFLHFMFGNGANYTLAIANQYAHQDWLEIIINQGVLGCAIYLSYFILFFQTWKSAKVYPNIFVGLGMIFIICFFMSLFSMGYGGMTIYMTTTLGYFLGMLQKHDNSKLIL